MTRAESPSTSFASAAECLALQVRGLEIANSMTARLTSDPASAPDLLAEFVGIVKRVEELARENAADYPRLEESVKAMWTAAAGFIESSLRALAAVQQFEAMRALLALAAVVAAALAQAKSTQPPGRNDPCPCGSRNPSGTPKRLVRRGTVAAAKPKRVRV